MTHLTRSGKRTAASSGLSSPSGKPWKPLTVAVILMIALFVVSCRSSRTASKVLVQDVTQLATSDTARQKLQEATQVRVQVSPVGIDTVALHLTTGMVDSLPEGASWVDQRNGTTLTATKTPRGLLIKTLHPRPPDVMAEASATGTAEATTAQKETLHESRGTEAQADSTRDIRKRPYPLLECATVLILVLAAIFVLAWRTRG